MTYESAFKLGDIVCVDRDVPQGGMTGRITEVSFRIGMLLFYQMVWWNEGKHDSGYFSEERLTLVSGGLH